MSVPVQRHPRVRMQPAKRREQILAAATALISERGYWGLSLQAVADACAISQPGLLHYFNSKDALLIAVLDHRDRLDGAALSDQLGLEVNIADVEDIGSLGIDLVELCDAIVRRNAGQREIVRLYTVLEAESLIPEHPANAYFAERQDRTLRVLASLASTRADREQVARHVLALLDGLQIQWLREPEMDLVAAWREASRQAPAALTAPA